MFNIKHNFLFTFGQSHQCLTIFAPFGLRIEFGLNLGEKMIYN
jgi:hypothetical protein